MEILLILTSHWIAIKKSCSIIKKKRLKIAVEMGDEIGQGGTVGNGFQSLGDYPKAIQYHKKRLRISTEISDRTWERGVYENVD